MILAASSGSSVGRLRALVHATRPSSTLSRPTTRYFPSAAKLRLLLETAIICPGRSVYASNQGQKVFDGSAEGGSFREGSRVRCVSERAEVSRDARQFADDRATHRSRHCFSSRAKRRLTDVTRNGLPDRARSLVDPIQLRRRESDELLARTWRSHRVAVFAYVQHVSAALVRILFIVLLVCGNRSPVPTRQ